MVDIKVTINGVTYLKSLDSFFEIPPSKISAIIKDMITLHSGDHSWSETYRALAACDKIELGAISYKGRKGEVSWSLSESDS